MRNLKVLLVGRGFERATTTLSHLAKRGCRYQCAGSLPEADLLVREQTFDLVLNGIYVDRHTTCSLSESLRGAPTTLLYSYEVEDGFWWILGLDRGRPCTGEAPAIAPSEFSRVLDLVLAELAVGGTVLPRILTRLCSGDRGFPGAGSSGGTPLHPVALRATAS